MARLCTSRLTNNLQFSSTFQPHKSYDFIDIIRESNPSHFSRQNQKLNHFNTLPAKDALKYICKTREFIKNALDNRTREFIKNAFNNRIWELGRNNVLNICELDFMIFCLFIVSNHRINTVLKTTLSFFLGEM